VAIARIDAMPDLGPLWISFALASVTTIILLIVGTPLALWLSVTRSRMKPAVEAVTALPLVLPPTVLGFYFLIALGPASPIGAFWVRITGEALTFSFSGLVVASVFYSLPFTVQPLQNAFESIGRSPLEAAATLRASPLDAFFSVVLPLAQRSFVAAAVLSFAHTIGEFGVVLMVGGNIPGKTKVISIAIYEHVETLNYGEAHVLAAGLLVFSFVVLYFVYAFMRESRVNAG
jgi:molybdate transport system permease protein